MAIVNLQDLQVTFGAKTAVSAASFRVDAGETFSLIGASGCGKSTILRVLAGLQREWRGSVDLLGQAITPGARFSGRSATQRADGVSGSVRLAAS
ncbi:dipeptide transport ATP-binding protein DppF [Klebsiella pneumoniae subsp. rhinoscleromatis]|nr:dipeptide transport ATP-binding protein DppF [Klebsiella pneumoniae subsp. rhinoscleromatis]